MHLLETSSSYWENFLVYTLHAALYLLVCYVSSFYEARENKKVVMKIDSKATIIISQ